MRTIRSITMLVVALVVTLTGCSHASEQDAQSGFNGHNVSQGNSGVSNDEAPPQQVTPKQVTPPRPTRDAGGMSGIDETFVRVVSGNAPGLKFADPHVLVETAHSICNGFSQGLSFAQIVRLGLNQGISGQDVGTLIGAAAAAYCPEYQI